jgi:dUTP pyrophosphatase
MEIKIEQVHPDAKVPEYIHEGDSGFDLSSIVDYKLEPLERAAIPTGLAFEIPIGYEVQIRPKSGLALNHGIGVLNAPGTIDSNYRGELKVILVNLGRVYYEIKKGQRVAQGVLSRLERAVFKQSDKLSDTSRGKGGFGSTGY